MLNKCSEDKQILQEITELNSKQAKIDIIWVGNPHSFSQVDKI